MGQKATTMPLLFPLFNWQRTPKYLLQHYIDIFAENASRDLDDSNLSKWFSHVVRNQLPPLVWEMIRRFSSDGRRSCMHDFVDPSQKEVWEELFALPDSRWDSLPDKGTDPQILVDDILSGIARGDFSAGEWGEQDVWERDVLSVFEKYMQLSVDQLVEGGRGVFEGLGYRAVLERPGAILGLVQHFLLADSPSSSDLQAFAADSSQLDQLFHLCQSPTATRITVLNAHRQAPPPYSIPLPAPRSKPTPVSFHRFQKLPNHSIHYPSVVILPPPRFCPPDICSGRRVVKPENYDLVSEKIRSLYRHKMDAISLAQVADRYDTLRMSTLVLLFPLLTSLESTPLIDKQQLLGAIKRAVQDCAGKLEIEIPINRVVMWSLGELARDLVSKFHLTILSKLTFLLQLTNQQRQPCLCDLTCMTDGLDRLESEAARVYLEDMEDARQRALQLMTLDTTELQTELEEMIRAGALSGDIWRGDWKRKVDELIRVTAGPMLQQILQRHREFTPLILRLAEILPSARILEEISSYTDDSTRQQSVPFSYQHFDLLVKNKMKAPSSLKTKEIVRFRPPQQVAGDNPHRIFSQADGKNIRLSKSVDVYQYAAILDPSNHSARLNSAALSQLADHGEQSFQSVHRYSTRLLLINSGP